MTSQNLSERAQRASTEIKRYLEDARDLRDESEELPGRHKENLPSFTHSWAKENLEQHLEDLEGIIEEPLVNDSISRLTDIGLDEGEVKSLPDRVLQNPAKIGGVCSAYRSLEDRFDDSIDFLIEDPHIIDSLRNDGPRETEDWLDQFDSQKYEQVQDADDLPVQIRDQLLKSVMVGGVPVTDVTNLNQNAETLKKYNIEVSDEVKIPHLKQAAEDCVDVIDDLRHSFGFTEETIRELVGGKRLDKAKELLDGKKSDASGRQSQLKKEIREYCDLLDKEPPSLQSIPELEKTADDLHEELQDEIGEMGERLWRFLAEDGDFPEEADRSELEEALYSIRPVLKDQL